ncbi:unnamed protein product, partial [Soboliphyme baturini]|uniref:Thiolase_N domain-containing protein n=1 Tax=Soboliphyme baturini TaxID=241478 RepID=A0A183IXE0_9BILA
VNFRGLLQKSKVPREDIEYVVVGSVISEVKTSNVAREASLAAGLPAKVPAHTVTMACMSSNQAITTCMEMVRSGHCSITVAGGVDTMSDVPIRIGRKLRRHLLDYNKSKSTDKVKNLIQLLNPLNWTIEFPSATEFSSNETMGQSGDRLATSFNISRKEQDEYAIRSHTLAFDAFRNGKMTDIIPVVVPGLKEAVTFDNGIRHSSMQQISKLKPVFRKIIGSATPANSSFLSDGASACLIMSEEKALAAGYKPKAYLRDYVYVAQDTRDQLLLGYVLIHILQITVKAQNEVQCFFRFV